MDEEIARRKLRFRSWNFGTRELDFLLGSFADKHLDGFNAAQLAAYEHLLTTAPPDLFAWITGAQQVPPSEKTEIVERLIAHGREAHKAVGYTE